MKGKGLRHDSNVSYYMVYASIREDNQRALACALSHVQTHKSFNNFLIAPECIYTLCIVRYLVYLHWSINKKCNNQENCKAGAHTYSGYLF